MIIKNEIPILEYDNSSPEVIKPLIDLEVKMKIFPLVRHT